MNQPSEQEEIERALYSIQAFQTTLDDGTPKLGIVGYDEAAHQIHDIILRARIETANHLHRMQGRNLPKRDFDNDTDEYICGDYVPFLEQQLERK